MPHDNTHDCDRERDEHDSADERENILPYNPAILAMIHEAWQRGR
jgi:hypothetical protein